MIARLLTLAFVLAAVPVAPPGLLDAWNGIHGDAIAKHIEVLASDEYGGRAPGTEGEVKTLAYITHQFESMNLAPYAPTGYAQDVPLDAVTMQGTPRFSMRVHGKRLAPVLMDAWVARVGRPLAHVGLQNSPLVFAGYGCVAPEFDWDDYAGQDLTGKTVVLLRGDPGTATGDSTLFAGAASTRHSMGFTKIVQAAKHGAKAAIIIHIQASAGFPWATIKGGGLGQTQHFLSEEPGDVADPGLDAVINLSEPASRAMFAAAGLDFDAEVAAAAKRGFKAHAIGGTADLAIDTKVEHVVSHNLIGVIPGAGAPDEAVLLMAHWDHMGTNPALPGDKIFNGAVDNATGVAAMLEILRAYKAMGRAPRRTVVFVATTAEERGLLGSEWLARHPVRPLSKTAAAIAIDALFPYGAYNSMAVTGYGNTELEAPLAAACARLGRHITGDGDPKAGAFYRADHWPFVKRGVPGFLSVGNPDNGEPDTTAQMAKLVGYVQTKYHQVTDEYDARTWDMAGIEGDARVLFEFSWAVAEDPRLPNFKWDSPYRTIADGRGR